MSFPATVFNVLIASPSDVPAERQAVADCLHSWNALNSRESGKVLLPVMWESHSAPSMADRPQGVINEQLVRSCDMLIGVFWTRLGSPTGKAKAGTVEEINFFMRQKKPVMLYFSKSHIDPEKFNQDQWAELKEFKEGLLSKGLLEQYVSVDELSQKLFRQITITMREVSVTPMVDSKAIKRAIAQAESNDKAQAISQLVLNKYSDKSFVVVGDSTSLSDELTKLGGKWIKTRFGGKAWCFSNRKLNSVSELIGLPPKLKQYEDI